MKLIVLDRDGVINERLDGPVVDPADWRPIAGSVEAIARLVQSGWHVAVATNQSGIAQGLLSFEALSAVHRRMHESVGKAGGRIDVIAFCPHSHAEQCGCRKPMPGMLYSISERLEVDLDGVVVVGDSLRDVQAAMAAAAKPVLVLTGRGQQTVDDNKGLEHIPAYADLATYVDELLGGDATDRQTR